MNLIFQEALALQCEAYTAMAPQDAGKLIRRFFPFLLEIQRYAARNETVIIAIDGRCGSGKTGLASLIRSLFPCNVIHMDDYYLPLEERTLNWASIPGGNMDFPRLLTEVFEPLRQGRPILYRPYDCRRDKIGWACLLPFRLLTVVEGSYSQHPRLKRFYDLRVFLTCDPAVQLRRLETREAAGYKAFIDRWIPMEERYYRAFHPQEHSDFLIDTGGLF